MKKQLILIAIGGTIAMVLVRLFTRKWRAEQKAMDEELNKQLEQMAKEMVEEASRHEIEMAKIEEEGKRYREELDLKFREDILELEEKVSNMQLNFELPEFVLKYRDKNGDVHTIGSHDKEGFKNMMRDRSNTLIFD